MSTIVVPVILSGGAGTRLWPLSRKTYPKPFMRLPDGQTLLEKTLKRAQIIATLDVPIVTVTAQDYFFLTQDTYASLQKNQSALHRYLLEPCARNTAAAVLLAAFDTLEKHGENACLVVLPADHWIDDSNAFKKSMQHALALAEQNKLVTFGIKPNRPETGYGYLRQGQAIGTDGFVVERFVEKPNVATARAYLESGGYWWNSGIFCFKANALLNAAADTCSDLLSAAQQCFLNSDRSTSIVSFEPKSFARIPENSIDYAVMEGAKTCAMVTADFSWSDIGSWTAVAEQSQADQRGNRIVGEGLLLDSHDTYIHAQSRVVVALGVSDLAVIETADAVLVTHRDSVQDVKRVVDHLREHGHETVNLHRTVHRPWGSYSILEDASDCKVKRLTVKPGHILSLQMHHRRSEHWTVVSGTATVRVGEREFLLHQNESTFIPMGVMHRLENATQNNLHLIETQCGDYFGEDDIVRFEDRYGRTVHHREPNHS